MAGLPKGRQAEARRCTEAVRNLLLGYKAHMEEAMRPAGITLPQLRMLHAIDQQQTDVSAATIARLCHITPQTLQSILARATREGWITRGSSQRNGRILTAALTPTGRAILHQGMAAAEAIQEQIWRGLPVASMRSMRETLEAGLANLDRP